MNYDLYNWWIRRRIMSFKSEHIFLRHHLNYLSVAYIKLLRPKDWAKNLFLFIPLFFSGELFNWALYPGLLAGFLAFCCIASSIYIINDYRDIEEDRKHPEKFKRPLASGAVSKTAALVIAVVLILS